MLYLMRKFLESVCLRCDFFITHQKHLLQCRINKPNFKDCIILNEEAGFVLVEMGRMKIHVNKFIQAGVSILDVSITIMYNFHYKIMKQIFPQLQLTYTNTDSLIYNIHTSNLYAKLKENSSYFDFASYNQNHPCYDATNNKVLGKFKDEVSGKIITEFYALRAKL